MKLLIRADASTRTGTGHVMRCLALAQAWREAGGTVSFAQAQSLPSLLARLEHEEIPSLTLEADPGSPADAAQTIALAQQVGADWLVADSYHFGSDYQQRLKEAGLNLLIVDDYGHAEYYRADIILNQNISAHEEMYAKRNPATRLLLGPRYAMLRSEFWPWRGWQREVLPLARRVLVTMGGSDPDNVTHMVIQALHHLQGKNNVDAGDVTVVVGGSNPHFEMLTSAARDMPAVQVVQNVSDMPQWMAWADVAIAAGGSTNWELAFMGLPTITIVLAENQSPIAEHLHRRGVVHNLGWYSGLTPTTIAHALEALLSDAARRGEMARRGRELVDGEGVERIVMHLHGDPLRLRPVRESDCLMLWEWANHPQVRAWAFRQEQIPWESHQQWFAEKLDNPRCVHYLALLPDDQPAGQIRFDLSGDEAEVGISMIPGVQAKGYGSFFIRAGVKALVRNNRVSTVHSFVKQENLASLRAFEKAGFQRQEVKTMYGCQTVHLTWNQGQE